MCTYLNRLTKINVRIKNVFVIYGNFFYYYFNFSFQKTLGKGFGMQHVLEYNMLNFIYLLLITV